jgi:hypothetical protein
MAGGGCCVWHRSQEILPGWTHEFPGEIQDIGDIWRNHQEATGASKVLNSSAPRI